MITWPEIYQARLWSLLRQLLVFVQGNLPPQSWTTWVPKVSGTLRDVLFHRSIAVLKACIYICLGVLRSLELSGFRRKWTYWRTDAPGSTIRGELQVIALRGCSLRGSPLNSTMFWNSFEEAEYFRLVVTSPFKFTARLFIYLFALSSKVSWREISWGGGCTFDDLS